MPDKMGSIWDGSAFKWKIAFHYQDRHAPVLGHIFNRDWPATLLGDTAKSSMAPLRNAVIAKRACDLGIQEFAQEVWEAVSEKLCKIWKLSRGLADLSPNEWETRLEKDLGVMHGGTGKGQGRDF